jgi:hypothetical protein
VGYNAQQINTHVTSTARLLRLSQHYGAKENLPMVMSRPLVSWSLRYVFTFWMMLRSWALQ